MHTICKTYSCATHVSFIRVMWHGITLQSVYRHATCLPPYYSYMICTSYIYRVYHPYMIYTSYITTIWYMCRYTLCIYMMYISYMSDIFSSGVDYHDTCTHSIYITNIYISLIYIHHSCIMCTHSIYIQSVYRHATFLPLYAYHHSIIHETCVLFTMGWLRLVGSLKLQVSFAKEPYKRDDILQKRPIILRSLLIVATP